MQVERKMVQQVQGPPGSEDKAFSSQVDQGGTTLSGEQIVTIAADIAEKQMMGEPLSPAEQFFVEKFFPNGIPPELADMSTNKLEAIASQNEAAQMPQGPMPQAPGGQY